MTETTATPAPKPFTADARIAAAGRARQPQGGSGAVYGLGMIGALVYFAGNAKGATDYALAFGKAMVWPALMVYRAFKAIDA